MTDRDTKTSLSHLDAKTPTPVPRTKVRAWLFRSIPACVLSCLCVNALQCTSYGSFCPSLSAVKCSVVVYA